MFSWFFFIITRVRNSSKLVSPSLLGRDGRGSLYHLAKLRFAQELGRGFFDAVYYSVAIAYPYLTKGATRKQLRSTSY
jgi:hypothetical protein